MELATRKGSKKFVAGLAKFIEKENPISAAAKAEWQHTKEVASRLYDPKNGGQYEIFNERPMKLEIILRDSLMLASQYLKSLHCSMIPVFERYLCSKRKLSTTTKQPKIADHILYRQAM